VFLKSERSKSISIISLSDEKVLFTFAFLQGKEKSDNKSDDLKQRANPLQQRTEPLSGSFSVEEQYNF
jgi:hypothetical protein